MRLFDSEHQPTTDDWYTPPWVFEMMGVTFGTDPAAPPGGVPWIPAERTFSIADDGLSQEWVGTVWLNPPYSAPTPWCYRWVTHRNGIIVLRADLSTRGPAAAFGAADAIFVPTPRLQFVNHNGETAGKVNFTTVMLGVGETAVAALTRLGTRGLLRHLTP